MVSIEEAQRAGVDVEGGPAHLLRGEVSLVRDEVFRSDLFEWDLAHETVKASQGAEVGLAGLGSAPPGRERLLEHWGVALKVTHDFLLVACWYGATRRKLRLLGGLQQESHDRSHIRREAGQFNTWLSRERHTPSHAALVGFNPSFHSRLNVGASFLPG